MSKTKWKTALNVLFVVVLAFSLIALALLTLFSTNQVVQAEDLYTAVDTEQLLKQTIENAGSAKTLIKLTQDIELKDSEVRINQNQDITIDLNGHTLSRKSWVIVNWWGKLTLEDSSPEKTGTISAVDNTYIHALVYNYGTMVSGVNFNVIYQTCVAVSNVLRFGQGNQYVCNPSLTINGGVLTHQGSNYNGVTLLEIIDGDLTITGGTFVTNGYKGTSSNLVNVSSTEVQVEDFTPEYGVDYAQSDDGGYKLLDGAQEKIDAALERLQPTVEAYEPHRHSKIIIEDGDFTSFTSVCTVLKIAPKVKKVTGYYTGLTGAYWRTEETDPYDATVTITGGKWGKDLSGYVPEGKWMELVTEDETGYVDPPYYRVGDVIDSLVEAELEVNDKTYRFASFLSAWDAAKATVAEKHVIKLLKDSSIKVLNLQNVSGDMILDLNGHKLKIDPENKNSKHIDVSGSSSYSNRFVIRDTSEQQDGELELSASKGVYTTSFFYLYSGCSKIVLESGTIRQTGLVPTEYKDYSTDSVTSGNNQKLFEMSLFKFAPSGLPSGYLDMYKNNFSDTVTIKGGNIISELNFGTADKIDATQPGVLVGFDGPNYGKDEFGVMSKDSDKIPDKDKMFVFDLESYLEDGTKACKFSWDFNSLLSTKGLTSSPSGSGYIVTKVQEGQNFFLGSNSQKYATLNEAVKNAVQDDMISMLQSTELTEEVVLDKGITLNMNNVANFTLTISGGSLTLGDGAALEYGVIDGDVTVTGDARFSGVTITGNVNATGGILSIDSGTYQGQFTVEGATLAITGGSFRGDQIATLDQYFGTLLGAYIEAGKEYVADTQYSVQIAPNIAAQTWYKKYSSGNEFQIGSTDEWNYFALYVNSGADSFKGKSVKLTAPLDFGGTPEGVSFFGVREAAKIFLTAGNLTHSFMGSFDGDNNEISGIVMQEMMVGLFGATSGSINVSNVHLKNCVFTVGNGYLDAFNAKAGYLAGGAIIGDNPNGSTLSGITLESVTIGKDIVGYSVFSGGLIGHSWSSINISDSNVNDVAVSTQWKAGGLVGFTEGSLTVSSTSVSEVTFPDDPMWKGAIAGNITGSDIKLHDVKVEGTDNYLIGAGQYYAGQGETKLTIDGPETDIHVSAMGNSLYPTIKPEKGGSGSGFSIETSDELPSEWFDFSALGGGGIIEKDDQGKHTYTVVDYLVAIWRDGDFLQEHYNTLAEAITAAQNGDELHVYGKVTEGFNLGEEDTRQFIIVLNGFSIDGGSGAGISLVCWNTGNVKITNPDGNINVTGKVTFDGVKAVTTVENNGTLEITYCHTNDIINNGTLTVQANSKVYGNIINNGTITIEAGLICGNIEMGADASLTISGGTFTGPEIVADSSILSDYIVVNNVAVLGEEGKFIVKKYAEIAEGDLIVAGSSNTEFKPSEIAPGYCYVEEEKVYYVRSIDVYFETLLSELQAHKQQLLDTYLYSDGAKSKLDDIYNSTKEELEGRKSELTMQLSSQIMHSAEADMDAVLTLNAENEANAQALEQLKKEAASNLQLYAASKGVSLTDKSVTDGLEAIEKATSESEVTSALTSAQSKVDSVKAAQDRAEQEQGQKTEAAQALKEAKQQAANDLKLYALSQGVSLSDKSVTDGLKEIEDATNEQLLSLAVTSAQSKIDEVKQAQDKAQAEKDKQEQQAQAEKEQQAQSAQALKESKQQAANDLKLYATSNGVSLTDKSVTDGLEAIEKAASESEVTSALTSAQSKVDEVKQAQDKAQAEKDKQEQQAQAEKEQQAQSAQALKESKQQAANDLKLYATSNGVSLTDKSVTDGLEAIEKATSESEVTSALTSAQSKVDGAKVEPEPTNSVNGFEIALLCICIAEVIAVAVIVTVMLVKRKKNK